MAWHAPLDWRPGRVRGFRLRFNLEGRPRGKAAPANLFADPEAEVWGVLYRLTRRNLVRLDATEGIPWSLYRPLWLDAEDINGQPFPAMTYIAHGKEVDSRPSLRYITLLRDGARCCWLTGRRRRKPILTCCGCCSARATSGTS
jgi:cation transport regulator ChaC